MSLPLEVVDCVVRSPKGRELLSVSRLELSPGTALGIKGPSGAGKSTLLYALGGLLERMDGTVRWGDTELSAMTPAQRTTFRANHVGMVFQDFLLFEELNALANASAAAMYAPRHRRRSLRERARHGLARLGISTEGRGVASFSGGERQRVAIARALANDAGILLADEPTASLDRSAADALIVDLVAQVRDRGKTLIAVSHDTHLLDRMDRVITLIDGQVLPDSATQGT